MAPAELEGEWPVTIILSATAVPLAAVASLYFAWRSREFRKFLAGALFVLRSRAGGWLIWQGSSRAEC